MSLRDIELAFEYRTDSASIVDSFYVPCLRESVHYWRAVGYFTSQGLALAAKGLYSFVAGGGRMRLVASPYFEREDIEAIEKGYETRGRIAERALLRQLPDAGVMAQPRFLRDRLSCLAWLIAEGRLDIKIALPMAGVGGIYHEKVGLFFDQNGHVVAFTGSVNETFGGLAANFESIDVFRSWDDPHGRTQNKKRSFERLWDDSTPGLKIIGFPSAARSRLLSYRSDNRPQSDPEEGIGPRRCLEATDWTTMIGGRLAMNDSMLTTLLCEHIAALTKEIDTGPCLLVYQGFPADFVAGVCDAFQPLNEPEDLYQDSRLRLDSLTNICRSSIGKVVGNEQTIYVATFEELLTLDRLINLSELVPYPIIVFRNNLFDKYPNLADRRLPSIDETIELGEPNPEPDATADAVYAYSEDCFGFQLTQYRDLYNAPTSIEYRDFFLLTPLPEDALTCADEACVPAEAVSISHADKRYFMLKYGVFSEFLLGGRRDFDVVTDNAALRNTALNAELMCLKSIYEANGLGLTIWVKRETRDDTYRDDFRHILKRHWGSDSFRPMTFYDNPDLTSEKYTTDQGVVIEAIVQQAERAREGEQPSDIFVTAPTGSGKSVLFQIPAIYLAERYGLVTVVVSPLKALMYDQVTALENRGVRIAAYINSDITLMQRTQSIARIKNGEVSILYLSPELLLSHDLRQFIGDQRSLGLLVVDEAHLVSTWGKDFRIDYWYLGTYIKRLRKYMGGQFPVLGLTATAVYGGPDDVVFETAEALKMGFPKLFIGNVRRDEVRFRIRRLDIKPAANHELVKVRRTAQVVRDNIDSNRKTIVYCPYVDHVRQLWDMLAGSHDKCGIYHGSIEDPYEKQIVMDRFQSGQILVVIATKAFGMGIDVDDISEIYHHAPSGTLADYVQEIGRVARRRDVQGVATTDFDRRDLKFSRILWGLSKIKQYEAKYVLQKLNDLYTRRGEREMLLSVEDFSFVFGGETRSEGLENRVKSALLLIEKDLYLKTKQQYPVVMVRPKALYSIVYACVEASIATAFLAKYGEYCQGAARVQDNIRRINPKVKGTCSDTGNIYELKLREIWEKHFRQLSFPEVKRKFFMRELFGEYDGVGGVYPRYRVYLALNTNAGETLDELLVVFERVRRALTSLGGRAFDIRELIKVLREEGFKTEAGARRVANLLVSLYSGGWEVCDFGMKPGEGVLLTSAGSKDNGERLYKTVMGGFNRGLAWAKRKLNAMFENTWQVEFDKFISPTGDGQGYILRMACLVEAFGLGSYQVEGGRLSQIFVRINDPYKLRRAALDPRYSNSIITDIEKRHDRSGAQMEEFFTGELTDEERWSYIESYFLGREEAVPVV